MPCSGCGRGTGCLPGRQTRSGASGAGGQPSSSRASGWRGFFAAATMGIAGPILVAASPAGPVAEQRGRGGRWPEEVRQQVLGFGRGQGDERRGGRRLRLGRLSRAVLNTEADQEGVGKQHQGEVAIPAQVATYFLLVEAQVFGGLQVLFDVKAGANGLHDEGQRGSRRRKDEVGSDLAGIIEAATQDEEVAVIDAALMHDGQDGPGEETLAFGAQALGEQLPVLGAQRLLLDGGDIGEQGSVAGLASSDLDGGNG
jgi:hypothetical protein